MHSLQSNFNNFTMSIIFTEYVAADNQCSKNSLCMVYKHMRAISSLYWVK